MEKLRNRMEEGNPIVLQQELVEDDSIDTGLRNIQEQVANLRQKDKLVQGWVKNGKRAYAHADADVPELRGRSQDKEELRELIVEAHQKAEDILGGYRQPSLEETAFIGGFDTEDERFREAFFQIKQQEGWNEPSQKEIEDWKDELTSLIAMAVASNIEGIDPMEIPGEDIYSVEEYVEKNKGLIEKIEVQETKVGYELRLPTELSKFTDQRIISIDRVEEGSDGDVLTVR